MDWDSAVSIVGHDIEIKTTYENILMSTDGVDLFIDVGANYGTHSLLFMSHGVPTVSFEPNAECFPYHNAACRLNSLSPNWMSAAVGSENGLAELVYPEGETWHGSISPDVIGSAESSNAVRRTQVEVVTVDGFFTGSELLANCKNILMKIDVEGAELEVLKGSRKIIKEKAPLIIFESNERQGRDALFEFMQEAEYVISELPWQRSKVDQALNSEEFMGSSMTNFIAVPRRSAATQS
ncbi:MAG: FkbM family methyltransferase [Pseudomonadota bacterium]